MSSNYAIAFGAYLVGLTTHVVAVKATVNDGGTLTIGEMPNKHDPDVWREARMRVRASLASVGIDTGFTITFDHAPPHAPGLDLAIFAACLGAVDRLPSDWFAVRNHNGAKIFVGELSLNGRVRPVRGVLAILHDIAKHRKPNDPDERSFIVPNDNSIEASYVDTGTSTFAIAHVSDLFDLPAHVVEFRRDYVPIDVCHFVGSLSAFPERVVRAIERAAIDNRPISFIGDLAFKAVRLICDLLDPMARDEAVETAAIHSIGGWLRNEEGQIGRRPFRAPHHTISESALVGGGDPIRPGEVSLAHNGVLYLDNLPEFKRSAIERLANVLRNGRSSIRRIRSAADYPARPLLVTSCPQRCPCGYRNETHSTFCTDERRKEWQSRHLNMLGIATVVDTDFIDDEPACDESIEAIRARVAST